MISHHRISAHAVLSIEAPPFQYDHHAGETRVLFMHYEALRLQKGEK